MNSPWGTIQHARAVAEGATAVGTASHGGLKLDRKLNAQMPDYMRRVGGWYEEDCEWCLPFVALESHFSQTGTPKTLALISRGDHKKTLASYFPEEYKKFFGEE